VCGMWGWLPGGMAVRGAASGATTVSSAPTAASHMVATLAFPFSTAIFCLSQVTSNALPLPTATSAAADKYPVKVTRSGEHTKGVLRGHLGGREGGTGKRDRYYWRMSGTTSRERPTRM